MCRYAPSGTPAAPSDVVIEFCVIVCALVVHRHDIAMSIRQKQFHLLMELVLEEIHLELHVTALCTLQFLERLRTREPEKPRTL